MVLAGIFVWFTSKYKHMQFFHAVAGFLWLGNKEAGLLAMITPSCGIFSPEQSII